MTYPQHSLPFDLITPDYFSWKKGESIAHYAKRFFAELIESGSISLSKPLFIAGISLGGAIAQEIAKIWNVQGLILLGSLRSSREISPFIRWFGKWIAPILPNWVYRVSTPLVPIVMQQISRISAADVKLARVMYHELPPYLFQRAFVALTRWRGCAIDIPTLRIHGAHDHIVPTSRIGGKLDLLPKTRHLVSLSAAGPVNEAIVAFVTSCITPEG